MPALDSRPARRHDLDALRAVAMLLGIVLHAVLSFAPRTAAAWPVSDVAQTPAYDLLMSAIHGFRMPLFFLLSGFFTAMLWRTRGLRALLKHRAKRIGLPLLVGMFTIVPATWAAFIFVAVAGQSKAVSETPAEAAAVWQGVEEGRLEPIQAFVDAGHDLNLQHAEHGGTPLGAAVVGGHTELLGWMLDHGADPDFRSRDGDTPLHLAAFFGRDECCRLLLDHGADASAKSQLGSTPLSNARLEWGTTRFFAGLAGVDVDREQLEAGRAALIPMLEQAGGGDADADSGRGVAYFLLVYFPVFHHLWFLWYLCWLVPAFAVGVGIAAWFPWRGPPAVALLSPLRWLWLVPLTLVPQLMMGELETLYGPDTSTGLIPAPHILLYYAVFFFVGAWYYETRDDRGRLFSGWRWMLPVALLVVFPLGYELTLGEWGLRDAWLSAGGPASEWVGPLAAVLQVLYVWLMVFGAMGLFAAVYSDESRVMRYLSDSSYWLYLAHMPVVVIGQYLIADWPLPSVVKIGLLLAVVSGLLLLSYDWLVRYTWIGRMLNGPRTRPTAAAPAAVEAA